MYHIHFPFLNKDNGHPRDVQSHTCPCVSFGIWACNIWSVLHPGNVMRCNGKAPPDACPILHSNDVIVSHMTQTKLMVPE